MKNAQRLAFATALMTVVLIGVGVYVRASGSGLGCPDWPTCHGGVVPPNHDKALIEFSHRITATIVGFMVIGTALMAWRHYRHTPFTLWTAIAAVPLVGIQGLLGALTVVRELPPEVVATHLVTAMLVLACELCVAWSMWMEDPDRRARVAGVRTAVERRAVAVVALASLGWLAGVMWVGGYMTESGAATACSGWPACNGSVLPAANDHEITHMVHRYVAGLLIFFVAAFVTVCWRRRHDLPWALKAAVAVGVLYVAQVVVGAFNVWYTFPDWLTVSHTVIAASIWFALSSAAVRGLYRPRAVEAAARELSGREVPA